MKRRLLERSDVGSFGNAFDDYKPLGVDHGHTFQA